jgi:asparagine synthase (glutamine-hydrolysing)
MDLAGRINIRLLNSWTGSPKNVLRVLAARLGAPSEVTIARKKGFNFPIARLLRRELAPLANRILERQADVLSPYLQPDGVRELWRAHRDKRANNAFALWPILTLAVWRAALAEPHRQYLFQPASVASSAA